MIIIKKEKKFFYCCRMISKTHLRFLPCLQDYCLKVEKIEKGLRETRDVVYVQKNEVVHGKKALI